MGYDYEYDESGVASSYLVLSLLIPVGLYLTYDLMRGKAVRRVRCVCRGCSERHVDRKSKRKVVAAIVWVLVAYLASNVGTLKMDYKKGFDPLEVLGVEDGAGAREVKKRLRQLLMKYNVSKAPAGFRKEYEDKQKMINKAYGLVSNKERYEAWLNSESKTGEIVAIPGAVVRHGMYAFAVYSVVLGVLLPRWAYRRWREMRDKNRVGVRFRTMEMLYERIDGRLNQVRCPVEMAMGLVQLIAKSAEFAERRWRSNVDGLRAQIESGFGFPLRDCGDESTGYLVLMDHLFRTGRATREDREYVQRESLRLIEGMKAIGAAKRLGGVVKGLIVLEGMIIQAVFDPRYAALQIPFVRFEDVFMRVRGKGRAGLSECVEQVEGGEQQESARNVWNGIPRIEICEFNASVIKTGVVGDGDDVESGDSDDVVVAGPDEGRAGDSSVYVVPGGSIATVRVTVRKTGGSRGFGAIAHAPYMKEAFRPKWAVMLTIDNVMYGKMQVVDDFEKKASVRFGIDVGELKKTCECKVFVGCGEYVDVNAERSIVIKVE